MSPLIALPPEILHDVLKAANPEDLAALSQCCQALHKFIYGNKHLFKDLYLQRLDEPPQCISGVEPDWEMGLHKLVRLQRIMAYPQSEKKERHFHFVASTVTEFLKTAAPRKQSSLSVALLSKLAENEKNQKFLFCNSSLFQKARGSCYALSSTERQLSGKLHCLYGIPIETLGKTRSSRIYPHACAKVYDLRNYTSNTRWGPFLDDGSLNVDWEKVEAIMVVIGRNLRIFSERYGKIIYGDGIYRSMWSRPFAAAIPNSYASISVCQGDESMPTSPIKSSLDVYDPFNVTGTYMRVVCFLDFADFFEFNHTLEPRPPLDTAEAIRIIIMEIRATKIEAPSKEDDPTFPVVHFSGISHLTFDQGDPNINSSIQGTVRLTREGEVRWTSLSTFQGEERWRGEGIQVGGICSARGVLGHWFDKDYGVHGPGPTAFWKISDQIVADYRDLLNMLPL